MKLQEIVCFNMKYKDWVATFTKKEYLETINNKDEIYGDMIKIN